MRALRRIRVGGASEAGRAVRTYLVLVVVAAAVAIAAGSAYGFLWSAGQARDEAAEEMAVQSQRAAAAITSAIATSTSSVEGLAAQPGLKGVFETDAEDCSLVADGAGAFRSVRLDIVGPDGRVACSSDRAATDAAPDGHAGSAWLETALDSTAKIIDWNATDAVEGRPAIAVAIPLKGAGAVVLFLHVDGAGGGLARDFSGPEKASFTIVDRARRRVLSTSETPGRPGDTPDAAGFRDARSGQWSAVDGTERIFNSADVAGSEWRVFAGVRRSVVLADARGAFMRYLLVGVLALLVLVVAVWILNRRVAGPLRAVTAAVEQAGRESNGVRVAEAGTAELVTLARAVNSMLDVRAGHEAQLVHQATHDPLTGLANRSLLCDTLDQALGRHGDTTGIAVCWLGVDGLDIVTDGFGHDAGDHVLVEVAERLSAVIGPHDLLANFGGPEFIVLCDDVRGVRLGDIAARLGRCLEQPFRGPGSDILVHASIGIAVAGESATTSKQLLREADSAMRHAKHSGQAWARFDHQLQARATHHLATEHALRIALQQDQLVVHYQPLVDVATGRIVATEALVRWQHPERGLVPPLEFIPTAEQTGQIAAIGRFVLTRACEQAAAWAAAGHAVRMSVNVAVDQLRDEEFPGVVRSVLAETGLAPGKLCLEITESSLMREAAHGSAALARLKQLGVVLAIDDFGTGYSSLSYLHGLPVDELKIDRSFISRLDREPRDRHLVEAIIGMTRALGLTVVAEGVEDSAQWEFLADQGCNLAQGYLFSPPKPADDLRALLDAPPVTPLAFAG